MSEQVEQLTLWGEIYPRFHIDKKLRVIELFAGIGSQIAACNVLFNNDSSKYEHWKICEWAYHSYCAYNSLHIKDFTNYSEGKTKEELIARINGTSYDYETPLSIEQLNKKPLAWLQNAYNNVIATNNLINVMNVHGKDLEIVDTDKYYYLLTYSFPCQDLSAAGKRKGCDVSQSENENQGVDGEGTRSGLLWEVERILDELNAEGSSHLPQILLMENVDMLLSKNHINSFKKWEQKLRELGYTNYVEILNGTNYGIPQARRRVFCISILGDYAYDFPKKMKLNHKLKDFLEKDVDKKYYLSVEQIERIANWKSYQQPLNEIKKHTELSPTITARGAGEDHSGMILIDEDLFKDGEVVDYDSSDEFRRVHDNEHCPSIVCHSKLGIVTLGNYSPSGHHATKIVDPDGVAPTVMGNHTSVTAIPIKNNTSKGYTLAEDGDGIDISGRMEYHRGTVQKGLSQTLTTKGGNNVAVVESLFTESELALITPDMNLKRYIGSNKIDEFKEGQCASLTYPNGYGHGPRTHNECITLNTVDKPVVKQGLSIRKLTPFECWKLMGFSRQNFIDLQRNKLGDTDLFHLAGDSIIVCVLIALLSPMVYDHDSHIAIINKYVEEEIL